MVYFLLLLATTCCVPSTKQVQEATNDVTPLIKALGSQQRFVEARLTKIHTYAAYQPDKDPTIQNQAKLLAIGESLPAEGYNNLTPHEQALVMLVSGKIDIAIDKLEGVVKKSGQDNVDAFSDLASAYFTRGIAQKRFSDLVHALSIVDKTIKVAPKRADLQFNRALILEKLYLLPAAQTHWQKYLTIESDSSWTTEAHTHLTNIANTPLDLSWKADQEKLISAATTSNEKVLDEVIRKYQHFVRQMLIEDLLPNWANAYLSGQYGEANRIAKLAYTISKRMSMDRDGNFVLDLTSTIDLRLSTRPSKQQVTLATAYKNLSIGQHLLNERKIDIAFRYLVRAQALFAKVGNQAGEAFARLMVDLWETDLTSAKKDLLKLRNIVEKLRYPYVAGRLWRRLATVQGYQFEPSKALNSLQIALKYLEQTDDYESIAMVHFIMAEVLSLIGDKENTYQQQFSALSYLAKISSTLNRTLIFSGIATQLEKLGEPLAGLYFHNAAVNQSLNETNLVNSTLALLRRSFTYYKLGDFSSGLVDLEEAKKLIKSFPDKRMQNLYSEESKIFEANYQLKSNPTQAILLFKHLISGYLRTSNKYYLIYLYKQLAEAYLAVNDRFHAEENLTLAIQEFETNRKKIADNYQQIDFVAEIEPVYDQMISLQLSNKQLAKAFNFTEKSRARVLLDSINELTQKVSSNRSYYNLSSIPLSLKEISLQLPTNYAIVEYISLSDKVYIWVIYRGQWQLLELPINTKDVAYLVTNLRSLLEQTQKIMTLDEKKTSQKKILELSGQLYKSVFQPITGIIPKETQVVIVPDKELQFLPFSLLFDSNNKRYLIEDYCVSYAPSATVFLRCWQRDNQLSKTTKTTKTSAFIVANPSFDRSRFNTLKNLSWAEEEAEKIYSLYKLNSNNIGELVLLEGQTATKEAFLEALDKFDIVHFAGHSVENSYFPLYSQLLLAHKPGKPASDDDACFAYEIYRCKLINNRLVVLAACQTGIGQEKPGEGSMSFARAFLAAGSPAVIASLWSIDDKDTLQLSVNLHRNLLNGKDPSSALRAAQLELLYSSNKTFASPTTWGAFMLLGASQLNFSSSHKKQQ